MINAFLLAVALATTPANVEQVIQQAPAGSTITLTPGAYPLIRVYGLKPTATVTIDASAPGVDIAGIAFQGSSNWHVHAGAFAGCAYFCVRTGTSDHLEFEGATYGATGAAGIMVSWGSSYVRVHDNAFRDTQADGVDIGGSQFVQVTRNSFANENPASGAHPDCVQLDPTAGEPEITDILIAWNVCVGFTQGYDSFDHPGQPRIARVVVDDNVYAGNTLWAGGIQACDSCEMLRNRADALNTLPAGFPMPAWTLNGVTPPSNINAPKP